MLNKKSEFELLPNKQISVKANLNLIHNGIEYNIIREQIYAKDNIGRVKPLITTLNIAYKQSGQQEFVKQSEVEISN